MTVAGFSQLSIQKQLTYLKKKAVFLQKLLRGNISISLYCDKNCVFEVLVPRNRSVPCEIKCYERSAYVRNF
jgi:hypothetical protein